MKSHYRQTVRAARTAETGRRILEAALTLFDERGYDGCTLSAVADAAGVSMQTVIRRFDDKEGLVRAAGELASASIRERRDEAPVGDLERLVHNLVDHYETEGRSALRILADEHLSPALAGFAQAGRDYHAAWCERVFAPFLAGLTPAVRRRRLAQLIAICDVFTWKLLRLQRGLSAAQTRTALLEMLRPLTEGTLP